MKVILVMVQTLNGKITKGDDPDIESWTSKEDKEFFYNFIQQFQVSIMGSSTYDAAKANFKSSPQRKRIILTSTPEKYKAEGKEQEIEFTSESPKELIARLKHERYDKVLLLGGGKTNAGFFRGNLVDEFYLTLEPRIFGKGKPVVGDTELEQELILQSVKQLNPNGTLLLHYFTKKLNF